MLRLTCVASADAQQLVDVVHPDVLAFDHCKCTVISKAFRAFVQRLTKVLGPDPIFRPNSDGKGRSNHDTKADCEPPTI